MLMEPFYHERADDKATEDGPLDSSLPRIHDAHHRPPYPNFQIPAAELYSSLAPTTTAADLYISPSIEQYPIRTLNPSTTEPLDYAAYPQTYAPPQWSVGAPVGHAGLAQGYADGYSEIILPADNQYFQPVTYTGGSNSSHSLSPYEDHANGFLHNVVHHADSYHQGFLAVTLDDQATPITSAELNLPTIYPTYTNVQHFPEQSTYVDPPQDAPDKVAKVSNTAKPKKRLDQVILKQPAGQITKQKRLPIVKGDRGKQSRAESCWRCRRYKKPCHKAVGDCSSCITSGFRIWPSSLGCRRGQMTDFALLIIPTNIGDLMPPTTAYVKPMSWRKPTAIFDNQFGDQNITRLDKWDQLMMRVKSIKILGPGIVELIQIAATSERRHEKPNVLLTLTARCLTIAIDLWQIYVATTPEEHFNTKLNVKEVFANLRQLLVSAVQRFLTICLTGRIKDWFATFMAVNILGMVYILLGDTILAIPNKASVWPDIKKTLIDLRTFHPVCRDLLYVLAKGCDLLSMDWANGEEALKLVDDDQITCDAMEDLQTWRNNLIHFLDNDRWMEVAPLEIDLLPVMSLSRLFLPQKKEDRGRIKAG